MNIKEIEHDNDLLSLMPMVMQSLKESGSPISEHKQAFLAFFSL